MDYNVKKVNALTALESHVHCLTNPISLGPGNTFIDDYMKDSLKIIDTTS